jgi:hypothetical protein
MAFHARRVFRKIGWLSLLGATAAVVACAGGPPDASPADEQAHPATTAAAPEPGRSDPPATAATAGLVPNVAGRVKFGEMPKEQVSVTPPSDAVVIYAERHTMPTSSVGGGK